MVLALHCEGFRLKGPRMQRAVHESIEIGSHPALSTGLQRQMHTPVLRSRDGNMVRRPAAAVDLHRQSGKAERGEIGIQQPGADGQISGLKLIVERERAEIRQIAEPLVRRHPT